MIASWSSELLYRRLCSNRLRHSLLLATKEAVVLRVRDPGRTLDALRDAARESEVAALLQPVIGRVRVEGPETLAQRPQVARVVVGGVVEDVGVDDLVEEGGVAFVVELCARGAELAEERGVRVPDAAVEDQRVDARFEGSGPCGEVATERDAHQRDAGCVDARE